MRDLVLFTLLAALVGGCAVNSRGELQVGGGGQPTSTYDEIRINRSVTVGNGGSSGSGRFIGGGHYAPSGPCKGC